MNLIYNYIFFRFHLQRQSSYKDVPEGPTKSTSIIKHSISDVNISKSSSAISSKNNHTSSRNSFSRTPNRNSTVTNVSKIPNLNCNTPRERNNVPPVRQPPAYITNHPVDIYVNTKLSPDSSPVEEDEFIPDTVDRPVGLDLDDFLPVSLRVIMV